MTTPLIDLLASLVQIPSPNPPGDTVQIADFVADWLRGCGCQVRVLAPAEKPQAHSVVATLGSGDPVIMLHAHIDTVPIAAEEARHWSVDPYSGIVRNGRLYGKGSVDDKAPLAAMMQTVAAAAHRGTFNGMLVLVAAAEEEVGGQLGTRWLAEEGHLPICDFIIVGEQTHNRVATAHKGVLRAAVRATGKSVHATNPDRGINAITAMAKAVLALEQYHYDLSQRSHPLAGVPTCNVGVIQGGSTANAVPDSCVAFLDRRMIPPESPEVVKEELRQVIAAVDASPAVLSVGEFLISNWFSSTCQSALGTAFLDCVREILDADPGPVGYLPGSDAKHLVNVLRGEQGEMVIFGPGSYEVAHAYDEYVDLLELNAAAAILQNFVHRVM